MYNLGKRITALLMAAAVAFSTVGTAFAAETELPEEIFVPVYPIIAEPEENGRIVIRNEKEGYPENERIQVQFVPDDGYALSSYEGVDEYQRRVEWLEEDGWLAFYMPEGGVRLTASFAEISVVQPETAGTEAESENIPGTGAESGSSPGTEAESGSSLGTESGSGSISGTEAESGNTPGTELESENSPGTGAESGSSPGTELESGSSPGTESESGSPQGTEQEIENTQETGEENGSIHGSEDERGNTDVTEQENESTQETASEGDTEPKTEAGLGSSEEQETETESERETSRETETEADTENETEAVIDNGFLPVNHVWYTRADGTGRMRSAPARSSSGVTIDIYYGTPGADANGQFTLLNNTNLATAIHYVSGTNAAAYCLYQTKMSGYMPYYPAGDSPIHRTITYILYNGCYAIGTTAWNSKYSTGNWIEDFYITQFALHAVNDILGYDHPNMYAAMADAYNNQTNPPIINRIWALIQDALSSANTFSGNGMSNIVTYKISPESTNQWTYNAAEKLWRTGWFTCSTNRENDVYAREPGTALPAGISIVYEDSSNPLSRISFTATEAAYAKLQGNSITVPFSVEVQEYGGWWYNPTDDNYQPMTFLEPSHTIMEVSPQIILSADKPVPRDLQLEVKLKKTDAVSGARVSGAVFGVYLGYNDKLLKSFSDDGSGNYASGQITVSGYYDQADMAAGGIYVKEITAPAGYRVLTNKIHVPVPAAYTDTVVNIDLGTVKETPYSGVVEIQKRDAQSHAVLSGEDISGAKFKIQEYEKATGSYKDSAYTISYDAAKKKFVSQALHYSADNEGRFKIVETAAPNGYGIAPAQNIIIGANTTTIALTFDEPPITGIVEVEKRDEHTNSILAGEDISGAAFKIQEYSKAAGAYKDSAYTISYDSTKKKFVSQTLRYTPDNQGKFRLVETAAPAGYKTGADKEFTLSANTPTISLTVSEPPITGKVEAEKRDKRTNAVLSGEAVSALKFKVQEYSRAAGEFKDSSYTISYNAAKKKFVSQTLYYTPDNQGKFRVVETTAPTGYLAAAPQEVTLSASTPVITLTFRDEPFGGVIEVEKRDKRTNALLSGDAVSEMQLVIQEYSQASGTYNASSYSIAYNEAKKKFVSQMLYFTPDNQGKFKVVEAAPPAGYLLPEEGWSREAALTRDGQTFAYVCTDPPMDCRVVVPKRDNRTGGAAAGCVFTVKEWSTAQNAWVNYTVLEYRTDGNYRIPESVKALYYTPSNKGRYQITETASPSGYIRNSRTFTVTVNKNTNGKTLYLTDNGVTETAGGAFTNKEIRGEITLTKSDSERKTNLSQGDAVLSGAEYTLYAKTDIVHPDGITGVVYKAGEAVASAKTDANGRLTFNDLYLGSYMVRETKASEGYLTDSTSYEVILAAGDRTKELVTEAVESTEVIQKRAFELVKISGNDGDTPEALAGAGFTVYLISELSGVADGTIRPDSTGHFQESQFADYDFSKETPATVYTDNGNGVQVPELFTDENGYIKSPLLPYGTYIVAETTVPENKLAVRPFFISVDTDNRTAPIRKGWIKEDKDWKTYVKIIKKDEETKQTVLKAGAKYRLYDETKKTYVEQQVAYPEKLVYGTEEHPYTTTADGSLMLPRAIGAGTYTLIEVAAPEGYVVNGAEGTLEEKARTSDPGWQEAPADRVTFTIRMNSAVTWDSELEQWVYEVSQYNQSAKGRVTLYKHGEQLVNAETDSGREAGPADRDYLYPFTYKDLAISGAEFAIKAKETIYSPDGQGSVLYEAGAEVAKLITDEEGHACANNLPLGTYELIETKAGDGFTLDQESTEFTLAYAGQEIPFVFADIDRKNERQYIEIQVTKRDIEQKKQALAGAVYELYLAGDYRNAAGAVLPKDMLVARGTTGEDGTLTFGREHMLPCARYYIKEVKAPEGYMRTDEAVTVDAAYLEEKQTSPVRVFKAAVENQKIYPFISISKLADKTTGVTLADGRYEGEKESGWYAFGAEVIYTMIVRNYGNVTAKNLTVTDILSDGLRAATAEGSEHFLIPAEVLTEKGKAIRLEAMSDTELFLDSLDAGDSVTVDFKVTIKEGGIAQLEQLKNIVRVTGEYTIPGEPEPVHIPEDEDDWDEDEINILDPRISVAKLADKTTGVILKDARYEGEKQSGWYESGDRAVFTLTVANKGNVPDINIRVTEQMSGELLEAIKENSGHYLIPERPVTAKGNRIEVQVDKRNADILYLDRLEPGDSVAVQFEVTLKEAGIPRLEALENAVTVEGDYEIPDAPEGTEPEAIPEDEDDCDDDELNVAVPGVSVAKLADKTTGVSLVNGRYEGAKTAGTYKPGEQAVWRITVTNQGNVELNEITVEDTMSKELRKRVETAGFVTGEQKTAFGSKVNVTGISGTSVILDRLAAGDSVTLFLKGTVKESGAETEGLLHNEVKVTARYGEAQVPEDEDDKDSDDIRINAGKGIAVPAGGIKTGDESPVGILIALCSISFWVLAAAGCTRRRKIRKDK